MFSTLSIATLFVAGVSAGCMHGISLMRRAEGDFGYGDDNGPLLWHTLSPENSLCKTGRNQTPINIFAGQIAFLQEARTFNFQNADTGTIENLGSTIQVAAGGTTTIGSKVYNLQQFHVHTPSEHRIADLHYPLELHMVHQADDGSLLVIGLLYELTVDGSTTNLLTSITRNIDQIATAGASAPTGQLNFNFITRQLERSRLYDYSGSLTTPPCSEGVRWLVAENTLPLNVATYNAIKSVVKFNSRYTQNDPGEPNLLELACAA